MLTVIDDHVWKAVTVVNPTSALPAPGTATLQDEFVFRMSKGTRVVSSLGRIMVAGFILGILAGQGTDWAVDITIMGFFYFFITMNGHGKVVVTSERLYVRNIVGERIFDWSIIDHFEPGRSTLIVATTEPRLYMIWAVQRARITLFLKRESVVDRDAAWLNQYAAWAKTLSVPARSLDQPRIVSRPARFTVSEIISYVWPLVIGVVGGLIIYGM